MSTSVKSSKGSGCLALFGLPFAAIGVFMTAWMWREVIESRKILSTWTVVPAVIETTGLERSRGSKGGTTYKAVGTFSYVYEGRAYQSERLSLSDGSDNIGHFQQRLHRLMQSAHRSGRALDCRVNPDDPTQAVLNAEWRPEMALFRSLFGVVFGGVGLSIVAGGVFGFSSGRRERRLKILHPGQPWLWHEAWQSPVLEARLGGRMAAAVVALIWINVSTWPLWSAVRTAWAAEGAFKWVLTGALVLVVVASAVCARVIIHARKYRGARLELGSLPLRPGTPVEARLYLPQTLPLGAVLKLALVSERRVTTGSGKQRRTTTTKLWSHEEEQAGPLAPWQEIVFRCSIPDEAEETVLETPDNGVAWRFEARADVPGVDLKLDFELPVFRGPKPA